MIVKFLIRNACFPKNCYDLWIIARLNYTIALNGYLLWYQLCFEHIETESGKS